MYKFTNGIVVFDEKTRDAYIKAGMRLADTLKKIVKEVTGENSSNDGTIKEKPRRSNKKTK